MGRKKLRKALNKQSTPEPNIIATVNTKGERVGRFAIVSLLIGIIGCIFGYPTFVEWIKSDKQKYQEETFEQGDLKPNPVSDSIYFKPTLSETMPVFVSTMNDTAPIIKGILLKGENKNTITQNFPFVAINIGGICYITPIVNFYYGMVFPIVEGSKCGTITFGLGDDNRLYVSTEFKDLLKEETIGFIEYNHWKLYRQNMLDFDNGDDFLWVKDKQNNIVFSIEYEKTDIGHFIYVSGYFLNPQSVGIDICSERDSTVRRNLCISKSDSNWKQIAQYEISKIKPVFKAHYGHNQ